MQRIGVFVCHCGTNIAATVDVKKVLEIFMNNKKDKNDWINDTYNANYGFINKETIYRVKKDER